jgi:hypothetical protein
MIPFYWVNGPPNKKREKLSLKNFTHKAWKRSYSKGKNIPFGKVLFHLWKGSVITRRRGKKNSFAPKLIISLTGEWSPLTKEKALS